MHKQFADKLIRLVVSIRYIKVTYALSPTSTLTPLPLLTLSIPTPATLHCHHSTSLPSPLCSPLSHFLPLLSPSPSTQTSAAYTPPPSLPFPSISCMLFKSYYFLYTDYTWSWDTGMEFRETRRVSRYISLYVLETWWVDWCSYWWPAANSQW